MNAQRLPDLDEHSLDSDPIVQFNTWYNQAREAGVPQYDAMTLATATTNGIPSARMVLLKNSDQRGFVFFTNSQSRKGNELAANPNAALVFFWAALNRSVRIEGRIESVSAGESDSYFASRNREAQLSSVTSSQSEVIRSRELLDERYEELKREFEGKNIPRPPHWGGYRLVPSRIEFWQARFARLNDRVEYERQTGSVWVKRRLQP